MFYHFRRFRLQGTWHLLYSALHRAERERVGRHHDPSAAITDSQSVKTVEESAHIRGYDAHKCVKGRKRHLLVDTLGLPLSVYVTPADLHDTQGARCLLAGLKLVVPRLIKIWADAAYRGQELADWCKAQGDWELEVVERTPGMNVPERRQATVPNASTNRKPSALVLYLNQNIASIINHALELMGFRTRLTPFADEALSILDGDDRRYLVFMDNFHLFEEPRLLLAELQARPELRQRVMVIGVTTLALPIEGLGAPFGEIDDFLSIPFSADELFDKIEAVSATLQDDA